MNRMLINATQQEELRIALVNGQTLYDLDIEHPGREQKKANIYKGRITRIEPSLEAAFVDYGAVRHGFLPLKEIARQYFIKDVDPNESRLSIKDVIKEGLELIVQIDKEERGNKGAALTTFISLAGSYLVLMPNNPGAGGISRRIEGDDRDELKGILSKLNIPTDMGVIIRTAGVGRSGEELEWDLNILLKHWNAISDAAQSRPAPFLIHQESDAVMRAIRDYLRMDINEIIIDNDEVYKKAQKHLSLIRPDFAERIKFYNEAVPLFHRFHIESQIESAFQREVRLPSGGSIVIDHTEALVTIDINSSRATKGGDIEETAFNTNLEAADEIARQLRLRDLGGLIVIDFIDMTPTRNQREVENRLRDALRMDRARVQIGRISRFGLLEMSRQRLRSSLGETTQIVCPRCGGHGHIRSIESFALSLLRLIRENALKENTARVLAQLPVEVATFLLNEKRNDISKIQQLHQVDIIIIPNKLLETPNYTIERIRKDEASHREMPASYKITYEPETTPLNQKIETAVISEQPAVDITQITPVAPSPVKKKSGGFWSAVASVFKFLFGSEPTPSVREKQPSNRPKHQHHNKRSGRNSYQHRRHGNNRYENKRNNNDRNRNQENRGERDRSQQNDSARSAGREHYQKPSTPNIAPVETAQPVETIQTTANIVANNESSQPLAGTGTGNTFESTAMSSTHALEVTAENNSPSVTPPVGEPQPQHSQQRQQHHRRRSSRRGGYRRRHHHSQHHRHNNPNQSREGNTQQQQQQSEPVSVNEEEPK